MKAFLTQIDNNQPFGILCFIWIKLLLSSFSESVLLCESWFWIEVHIIFLSSVDYRHCLLDVRRCWGWCATLCDLVRNLLRLRMSHMLYFGTSDAHILVGWKTESVIRRILVLSFPAEKRKVFSKFFNYGIDLSWALNKWCSHLFRNWRRRKKCWASNSSNTVNIVVGNPNLLIVEFHWKLIFLKLVFFRLASIKAVFFFPIGIC